MAAYNLLLGSGSPRRRELLSLLDIDFKIPKLKDVDETYPSDLSPYAVPAFLSRLKASGQHDVLTEKSILITADTVVIADGVILGKPVDGNDARRMLRSLSGRMHEVVTGVTLTSLRASHTFSVTTKVKFSVLSDEEIDYYVSRYNPVDKAGAYGIQEWIGAIGIEEIEGSFYNVMGLPVHRLYKELQAFVDADPELKS